MEQESRVWSQLRDVLDPETGVSLVELGIVQSVAVTPGRVKIALDGAHPLARHFAHEADAAARDAVPGWDVVVEIAEA